MTLWTGFPSLTPRIFGIFSFAQTPSAALGNPEIELLRKQFDFINSENARLGADFTKKLEVISQANKDLNESFKTFIETMEFVLIIFGFLGGAIAFVFGKNLR